MGLPNPCNLKDLRGSSLRDFVFKTVPSVELSPPKVAEIQTWGFEEMLEKQEELTKTVQDMTEQQKKERQEFERRRNEDEKKHASQLQKMADQQRKEREEFEKQRAE